MAEPTSIVTVGVPQRHIGKRNMTPCDMAPDRDAWERQKGESTQAYEGFSTYLDMAYASGERAHRSIRKAAEEASRDQSLFGRWSVRWRWVERTQAWDMHIDRLARVRLEDIALDVQRAKLMASKKMIGVVSSALERYETEDGVALKPAETAKLAESAARLSKDESKGASRSREPSGVEAVIVAVARAREQSPRD